MIKNGIFRSFILVSLATSCCVPANVIGATEKTNRLIKMGAPPLSQTESQDPGDKLLDAAAKKISLNFTSIPARELLQVIAQFTHLNFVISDDVSGKMSIHLKDVPWDEALDVILTSQSLGQRRVGQITYIAPLKQLDQQEISQLQAKQKKDALSPLQNHILNLHYAAAEDIAKLLTSPTGSGSLVSARGSVGVDKRTNSILIRDTSKNIRLISTSVKRLDFPTKQVMIEARVVTIERPYEQQLGARFGVSNSSRLSGTLEGANEIALGAKPVHVPIKDRLNFNVPATSIFGAQPASIGLAVARLGKTFVDMELSALQYTGHVELISSPQLVTANQHPAYIQVGEEIPYQVASSSGATAVEYKDAVLKLAVTPLITPGNRVILHVKISNNRRGKDFLINGGEGASSIAVPIDTEEEESDILVNDHQTVVLGGVYRHENQKIVSRVPFLGEIPVLGHLFKHTSIKNNKNELLIFLTPHIVNKPSDLAQ